MSDPQVSVSDPQPPSLDLRRLIQQPLPDFFGASVLQRAIASQLAQACLPTALSYDPNKGFGTDNPGLLAAGLTISVVAFDNDSMRALAGPDGYFTDGRVLYVDGKRLMELWDLDKKESKEKPSPSQQTTTSFSPSKNWQWVMEAFLAAAKAAVNAPGMSDNPSVHSSERVNQAIEACCTKERAQDILETLGYRLPFNPITVALAEASRSIERIPSDYYSKPSDDDDQVINKQGFDIKIDEWNHVLDCAAKTSSPNNKNNVFSSLPITYPDSGMLFVEPSHATTAFLTLLDRHADLTCHEAQSGEALKKSHQLFATLMAYTKCPSSSKMMAFLALAARRGQPCQDLLDNDQLGRKEQRQEKIAQLQDILPYLLSQDNKEELIEACSHSFVAPKIFNGFDLWRLARAADHGRALDVKIEMMINTFGAAMYDPTCALYFKDLFDKASPQKQDYLKNKYGKTSSLGYYLEHANQILADQAAKRQQRTKP